MTQLQQLFLLIFSTVGFAGSLYGAWRCRVRKDNLGLVGAFVVYGAFVWADIVVFGLFWAVFSVVSMLLSDWLLFLFGYSVFWFVRGFGESIYWFNQQFSTIKRNPLRMFFFSKLFNNDEYTIWFIMQIIAQCIAVVAAVFSVYFGRMWFLSM